MTFKRLLLGAAMLAFCGLFLLRLSRPPRNVLEEAFDQHIAGRVQEGHAAFVVFGDPKT